MGIRAALALLVLGPFVILGIGAGNMAAFDSRAAALERSWSAAQAAGVPKAQLAPARSSLQTLRSRRVLFLPYSVFSGALLVDPFGRAESLAAAGQAQALADARQRAQEDLARLKDVGGPNYAAYPAHAAELAAARRLADYVRLARAWETEAAQLASDRDQLTSAAGGLSDGLPKDVVDGVARLKTVIDAASQAQLSADPASQALTHAQDYLAQEYPVQLEQHAAIAAEVQSAADAVQHRLDLHTQADQLLGRLPDLLAQAARYSLDTSRVAQSKADVLAAEAAGDDSRMDGATAELQQAINQLSAAVTAAQQKAIAAADWACLPGSPAQLIIIHLATQKLIAYDNSCPFLVTLVTTGRPALRTDQGTFTIHAKYPSYLMHSPWQPSTNPLWYPDTVVHDAMLVVPADGTFIHSAEWEPASAYGPGSENGPYASHGCVHVMNGPLATLYDWAQIGATVIIED